MSPDAGTVNDKAARVAVSDASARPVGPGEMRLQHYALAGLASASRDALDAGQPAPEAAYLVQHLHRVVPPGASWADALRAYLSRPSRNDRTLSALARDLRLQPVEVLAVALAASVENDMMVGRALSYLQAPVGGSRPTLGLLHAAFADLAPTGEAAIDSISNGAAVRCGLLVLGSDTAPRPERTVCVPLPLCLALADVEGIWPGASIHDKTHASCDLPPSIMQDAARHAARLAGARSQALALRGGSLNERRAVAAAIAGRLGLRPVFLTAEQQTAATEGAFTGFGVWARLRKLMPVFTWELAPGESRNVPRLSGYEGPIIALIGRDGSVTSDSSTVVAWTPPVPGRDERCALWQAALGDRALADELAHAHRHRTGRITELASLARQRASLSGRASATRDDVAAVAWMSEGAGLDALAEAMPKPVPDEALVTTAQLRQDLNDLLARCRARDAIGEGLGPSVAARYHPGVKALFCGPSGAGKTLTVGWLATKLGMPLYRVDLASMTSKYIGETEKNLAQLLSRAEEAEIVLLFDEADSLFGKRTDIKESNDRFANSQTNYLLQRIESFDGIALLTSNSRSRFDAAFMRRLDLVIDFPLPGPEERRALWLSHLGASHRVSQQELNQISASVDLAGGHIRNAVISAAVRARGRAIAFDDVVHGVATEYRKLGKQMPANLTFES